MPDQQSVPLKTIDLNAPSFKANGKDYFIEKSISFERYLIYQKLEIELGFGVRFYDMFKNFEKIYELVNKGGRVADIAVIAHNNMSGIKAIDDRKIPALEMCALFINTKDEDRHIITDAMVDEKVKDWQAEGLDIVPFFQLAKVSVRNFSDAYNSISQIISEEKK